MMAVIIDGKAVSQKVKEDAAAKAAALKQKGIIPALAVVLVGENPASQVYVRNKVKACAFCGIRSEQILLPADTAEEELLAVVERLNRDDSIHGILVQLPLPKQIDETKILRAISPLKDVDAFHPVNVGKIMIGDYDFLPCTPAGCMELLKAAGVSAAGKHAVVVGRSNIVGKPMAMLLLHDNATVTICHSKTPDLKEECLRADILIAAVGREKVITADMVKPGAAVIDVGMNRNAEGKLCGDVDFAAVKEVAGAITPVPGGVGPMTIAMLMQNTVKAASLRLPDAGSQDA